MADDEITIRSVQHYLYCPHRWGLLEIDQAWAENFYVTKANLLHNRVHNPERSYTARGRKVLTSVTVYCDRDPYNLYGVTDCMELIPDTAGISLPGMEGKFRLCLVEYKPTAPKAGEWREEDLMQVFAQKICTDAVFGGDCEGVLYYADVKKRVKLPLRENFADCDRRLREVLAEMRDCLRAGRIPPIRKGQHCSGCSMKDLCMPKAVKAVNIHREIRKLEKA